MTNLKRILAGALSVCMAGSVMASCGNDSSSSTGDSKAAGNNSGSKPAANLDDPDRVSTTDMHGTESSEDSKNTLTIYCWNVEFQSRLNKFYPDYAAFDVEKDEDGAITTIDGKKVNWVQIENEANAYQIKLDEALQEQKESTEKVDMFLIEADYALKYVNAGVALTVQDLGITDDEMSNMYQYTKDVATDEATGELKGVSWQAAPGLFMYNADIAKEVLGTDDPGEVQEYVKDWAAFDTTAETMKTAGYKMLAGPDDSYRLYSNKAEGSWVQDGKVVIDPQISKWVEESKKYYDAGYCGSAKLWDDAWAGGMKIDGGVFGYFLSTWGIPFTLLPNTVDEEIKEDNSNAKEGNGGYGHWRATQGPEAYYWGGTWICGAIDADNTEIVADIMRVLTTNVDCMAAITTAEQDYTNNKASIQKLMDEGYTNPFLGGQNHLALLSENAEKISMEGRMSAYDQGCNEKFQEAMRSYFEGNSTYDEALEAFKTNLTALYGELTF